MAPLYGYAGKLLRVDLTSGKITEERIDRETARRYIGGTGIGVKYLYEEVDPKIDWSNEANRIIMASGPLGGTRYPGSGTYSVVTKGPLTNGAGTCQANGYFGAYLRFCGYEGIIIQGKAPKLSYLYIHDGGAELRDAKHLAQKDAWETEDLIKKEFGKREREMSVCDIGPAGENLVKFAAVCNDKGHVAGHNGLGAVMGSKRLKAIAVERGSHKIQFKDEAALNAACDEVRELLPNDPASRGIYNFGTLGGVTSNVKTGILPVKNYMTNNWDITPEKLATFGPEFIRSHFNSRPSPCYGCIMHHCHMMTIPEGRHKGMVVEEPEYEQFSACGPAIGVTDINETVALTHACDALGLENNEAGYVIGFVMECFEKGVLTKGDCDGLEITWGNAAAAEELLKNIATRKGFGDVMAEGVMRAAKHIGGQAPSFAVHTMKGNSVRGHDHRSEWLEMFDTCVSNTGTIETHKMAPRQLLGLPPLTNPGTISPEDTITHVTVTKGSMPFEDSLGTCRFTGRTHFPTYNKCLKAACGWDMTTEDDMEMGRRIIHLLKAFNIMCGITAEMDAPSPRYGSVPVDGPYKGRGIMPYWNDMRRKYYEAMGWDGTTGKPLPETLKKYGIPHVITDLYG
ncbi:MAG: aldehyde ferredoxin oxidoreductase C-terminal domain-containing protein [Chloroflexota bacterium]